MRKVYLTRWAWYDERKFLHIEVDGVLDEMGKPKTAANRRATLAAAIDYFKREMPEAILIPEELN